MSYTVQDYRNYARFIPSFFKGLGSSGETFHAYEILDVNPSESVPENAVAAVIIWTRHLSMQYGYTDKRHVYYVDSSGHGINPIEFKTPFDNWLRDVRERKEEFDAFMQNVAVNYLPMTVSEITATRFHG
jgi:hypothetical protein